MVPQVLRMLVRPLVQILRECGFGLWVLYNILHVYLQGRGADPEEHVRLGSLPKLTIYYAHGLLELIPALLHDIISLQALQVPARLSPAVGCPLLRCRCVLTVTGLQTPQMLVQVLDVTLCYDAFGLCTTNAYSPANGGDITSLLQILPAMPSLRAAKITAPRRSVGPVDMCCLSHLEHLAIACAELALSNADELNPTIKGPSSLHIITEKASQETVGQAQETICPGLYAALA